MAGEPVLLLLSGGIDSAVLLLELRRQGLPVVAMTFDYGQRHRVEIDAAVKLAGLHGVAEHLVVVLDTRIQGASALLAGGPPVTKYGADLPVGRVDAYVPARNLMFLSHAAAVAEARHIRRIIIGFNADDATNFWDCSAAFVDSFNGLLRLASPSPLQVEAPLLNLRKADVIRRARELGLEPGATVSCYDPVGDVPCGQCLACCMAVQPA